jgi:hypothetical protein
MLEGLDGEEPERHRRFLVAELKAKRKPGLLKMLRHDFRRMAVRNLVNRGVPERVVMTVTGHKTRAVFDRYHIVSPGDLREVGQKLTDRFTGTLPETQRAPLSQPPGLLGGADRSGAEIPPVRDGTRTRDLSARAARTVLIHWHTRTERLDKCPALASLNFALPGSGSLPRGKLVAIQQPPGAAASIGRRAPRLVSAEQILQIVRVAHIVAARRLALEDVDPVGHQETNHPSGWLEEVR